MKKINLVILILFTWFFSERVLGQNNSAVTLNDYSNDSNKVTLSGLYIEDSTPSHNGNFLKFDNPLTVINPKTGKTFVVLEADIDLEWSGRAHEIWNGSHIKAIGSLDWNSGKNKIFFNVDKVLGNPQKLPGPLFTPSAKPPAQPRRALESELKIFLQKLNALDMGQKLELSEFSSTDFSVYKHFYLNTDNEKYEESGESYHTLWIADINNDGKPDYVWTDEVEGSGHYDYLEVYDDADTNGIALLHIPQFKCDYSNIAKDLFTVEDGKTFFHLVYFSAQDKNGKTIAEGATSNAAEGGYYAVTIEYECLWSQGQVKVVEKKKSKEKYE